MVPNRPPIAWYVLALTLTLGATACSFPNPGEGNEAYRKQVRAVRTQEAATRTAVANATPMPPATPAPPLGGSGRTVGGTPTAGSS